MVVVVLRVRNGGVENLLHGLCDTAIGEAQNLLSLGDGLAANEVDDNTRLAGRNADVTGYVL